MRRRRFSKKEPFLRTVECGCTGTVVCTMERKVGPFEKWNVVSSEPMCTIRLVGGWFLRYWHKNYKIME